MIKKLQHRFIFITMACISFIFILILLALNISMTVASRQQGYDILSDYADRKANTPEPPANAPSNTPKNTDVRFPFSGPGHDARNDWFNDIRIFSVSYNTDGELLHLSTGSKPDLTDEELQLMADKVTSKSKTKGILSGYLYIITSDEEGTDIFFLDYSPEKGMSTRLISICLWIGLAGILLILIPVIFLSKWVSRPVQLAFDKQRQFIADASHELKTPLTIITTNAEVLQNSIPENKWLGHILDQSSRMKLLINNLLELAKLDSFQEKNNFCTFDLSKAVKNSALSFESTAFEYKKNFVIDIDENLNMNGNENSMKQLTTILLDNAFKYSDEEGEVQIKLYSHGDKKELLVRNTGKGISAEDQKHIFERFYRSDASRSRESGGYGLGLSIAKSIAEAHKGQIHVKSDALTYTAFTVTLP